jgi:predicted AAA+ superfamily ATPase
MESWNVWLIVIALLILATNFVDIPYWVSRLFAKSKVKAVENKEEGFLEIVSLWYQLKNKCDEYHLTVASEKLDEVFPLLNKVIEDNDGKVS